MTYPLMKTLNKGIQVFLVTIVLVFCLAGCTVYKNMPPGQAKKATGSKSAKQYAPGQVKKG